MDFKLTVYSDYVCPWCYVGQGVVTQLEQAYQVEVEWRPYYLRPDTPPEGLPLPDYVLRARANGSEDRLAQLANQNGLTYRPSDRLYNTRLAHEATEYAREHGQANEFHRLVFEQVFVAGADPANWSVLRSTAEAAGLNGAEMQTAVESGKYTQAVADQVQMAYQIGVQSVPTYVINDKYAIVGAQPYEAFKQALGKILNPPPAAS
ncbi:MAG: DsbA family oxidoreductase [Anaerolineales bacterium]|nr:DsbA family oxidoreductase [Anaerolineales bacterium]